MATRRAQLPNTVVVVGLCLMVMGVFVPMCRAQRPFFELLLTGGSAGIPDAGKCVISRQAAAFGGLFESSIQYLLCSSVAKLAVVLDTNSQCAAQVLV